jgi:hypothetical protein
LVVFAKTSTIPPIQPKRCSQALLASIVLPKREPTTPPQKLREPTTLPQKFQQHLQNFHTKQIHTQPNKENIRQATRSYFLKAKQNHNLPEAKTEGKCST